MDAPPDVRTLRSICEAERRADRILHEAEEEAAEILRRADREAAEILEAMRRGLPQRRRESLETAIDAIEREAGLLLAEARSRAEQRAGRKRAGIDRIADRLLGMVLPP